MDKAQFLLLSRELKKLEALTDRLTRENSESTSTIETLERQLMDAKDGGEALRGEGEQLRRALEEEMGRREAAETGRRAAEERCARLEAEVKQANEDLQEAADLAHQQSLDAEAERTGNAAMIGDLQGQAQRAIEQAESYHQRLCEYEQLLEVAVSTNKDLERDHQTCLDELQIVMEKRNLTEKECEKLRKSVDDLNKKLTETEDSERKLEKRCELLAGKLTHLQETAQIAELTVNQQRDEVGQYIHRKKRVISLRQNAVDEFQSSLSRLAKLT